MLSVFTDNIDIISDNNEQQQQKLCFFFFSASFLLLGDEIHLDAALLPVILRRLCSQRVHSQDGGQLFGTLFSFPN